MCALPTPHSHSIPTPSKHTPLLGMRVHKNAWFFATLKLNLLDLWERNIAVLTNVAREVWKHIMLVGWHKGGRNEFPRTVPKRWAKNWSSHIIHTWTWWFRLVNLLNSICLSSYMLSGAKMGDCFFSKTLYICGGCSSWSRGTSGASRTWGFEGIHCKCFLFTNYRPEREWKRTGNIWHSYYI